MDLSLLKSKLVGSDHERAVSPVIGVILMVAITVILAAVIAAFVLDLGDSVGQEAQAGVAIDVDESENEIQVEVTSLGNSDYVNISGDVATGEHDDYHTMSDGEYHDMDENPLKGLQVGDTTTIGDEGSGADVEVDVDDGVPTDGIVTVVAVIEADDVETGVASEEYDLDWENN
ncbi:type IV pilin [Natrialbaceae archaeon A-gly3]